MKFYPKQLAQKLGFNAICQTAADAAQSIQAKEQLKQLKPSSMAATIEQQLQQTREMMGLLEDEPSFPLHNLHEIIPHVNSAKAEGSVLSLNAFQEIIEITVTARRVKSFITDREELYPSLKKISVGLIPLKELEKQIRAVVNEQGQLRNDASQSLKRIRGRLNRKRSGLRKTINQVMARASKQGMVSDEGATLRGGRMVIPIQAEYKRKIKGFVHDVSASGQTVYLEPVEALNINNAIRQLEAEEQQEIERILRQLTNHIRSHRDKLIQNSQTLTHFDVLAAKAEVSISLNGFIPALSNTPHLYLKEAYNPILLLKNARLNEEQQESVIPLDLELTQEEACLIITGPNAGGKSVALKTLGLCVMMAQAGFAIPARDSSELPVYNTLFVDMGDDQSIENDLSTFSSRLQWMKEVQKQADTHSLVLIDEAAAGTDPDEGSALFQAFIETLIKQGAKIAVTTHHGALKVFAHDHPNAINGSMEFDQSTLSPAYRFKKGVPGSSYAFEIAERMQLNTNLLAHARQLLGEAKSSMETLITELETKTQQAEKLRKKYNQLQSNTQAEKNRYLEKRSGIEKNKEAIREKALKEAQSIMQSANRRIEEAVEKVVAQEKKDKKAIKEVRKDIEQHKKSINKQLEAVQAKKNKRKQTQDTEPPVVGDIVRLQDGKTTGTLKEINGKKAVVLAGGLRLKTKFNNLVKVTDASQIKKPKQQIRVNIKRRFVEPSIMIRGLRGEEAMKKVVRYLDDAIAAGRHEVDIIHGKGEGILKALVHQYLDKRKEVKGYRMAPIARGGAGCTIVEL